MPFFLAPLIGAAIGALGSASAARSQRRAADRATNAQTQVADQNNALQREIYDRNTANLNPFITQGVQDNTRINAFLASNPFDYTTQDFEADPGYKFRFDQGQSALEAQLAAGNRRLSGGALKAAITYGQGAGSQEYGNAFQRYQTTQGRYLEALQNGRNVGMSAASAVAGVGQGFANATSANNQTAADARSNAALYTGNVNANLWGGVGQAVGNAFGQSSYRPAQAAPAPYPQPYDPFRTAGAYR